jgi:protein-tyrosine phosphatase
VEEPHTLLTPRGPVTVASAQPCDLDDLEALYEDAARWLAARDINQWQAGYFRRDSQLAAIRRGECYIVRAPGQAVGMLTLIWADPSIWGEQPADAGYLHGLAVRRDWAGLGLGRQLLTWAERRVAAAGKPYLRLDCGADNPPLRAYYEHAGFIHKGDTGTRWRASLYEKPVGLPS